MRNRTKTFNYRVIEYDIISMIYGNEQGEKIEYAKTIHKTNSKLLMYLIIICLKIQRIKYEVIK